MPKITITCEFDNTEDAIIGLSALRSSVDTAKPGPVITNTVKPPKAPKTPPAEPAASTETAADAKPTATENAAPATQPTASFDYDKDVSPAIAKAVTAGHRDAVLALLNKFKCVKSGKELKPEAYGEFLSKLKAIVEPGEDLT